jgi:hypothetical protein
MQSVADVGSRIPSKHAQKATDMLSLTLIAFAIVAGTWLALFALKVATRRLARAARSGAILGGQIGAAAMTLPGFWLSIFIGAPLFGGVAIEIAGDRAIRIGALLGVGVTQFACVALGSAVGVSLSLLYFRDADRPDAN